MAEIGTSGWHSSDGRDRPTPEFVAYAESIGARIVCVRGTFKITRPIQDARDFAEVLKEYEARFWEEFTDG